MEVNGSSYSVGSLTPTAQVRSEEHEDYLKASSDFKDSAEAVAKAVEVLNEYYTSASFVQVARPHRSARSVSTCV